VTDDLLSIACQKMPGNKNFPIAAELQRKINQLVNQKWGK